jgi:hypothetical protein
MDSFLWELTKKHIYLITTKNIEDLVEITTAVPYTAFYLEMDGGHF